MYFLLFPQGGGRTVRPGPATAETKDRQAGGERRYPEIRQDRHHGTYIQLSHSLDQID